MPSHGYLSRLTGISKSNPSTSLDSAGNTSLETYCHELGSICSAAKGSRVPPRLRTNMSYKPLASDDPEEQTNYGSNSSSEGTPSINPSALLGIEGEFTNEEKSPPNPFSDSETAAYWQDVYDKCRYECRHVFNPGLTWTVKEEKELVRKLDWKVCLWACVMFFGLQVDRNNLSQAVSDNMLDDLGLSTNDYNYGNSIFTISFLFAELPSQLLSKALGPDRWIPMQMVLWSFVAISQCALVGRRSFFITRSLLGLLEGGFIPDLVLWLSYFYTSRELPIRLSYFWTTLSVTGIITSLLAFALLHLRGVMGWEGWRWLFLLEGFMTLTVGVTSIFMIPASAVQTKTWFRPQGWFTAREEAIVVNRVLRDDPSKGDMHNREALTPKRLWEALTDYDLWPLYAIGLVAFIPQTPPKTYITLLLRSLGFSTFTTNLLTIPAEIFHIVNLILLTRLSEKLNERSLVSIIQPLWVLPCIFALRFWPGVFDDKWGTYTLLMALLSYPYCHAILVGWCSKNSNNVGTRTVSAALYNMSVQTGSVFSAYVYREDDKPLYHRGNSTLLIINIVSIILFLLTKLYYVRRNKLKANEWNALTEEQQNEYRKNTRLQGSRRLDFQFAH
ncbi:major facilitator superfamily domain-containing protein [Pseudomassariella vexata]|uniref:Major facilitator superfamily domain-containing protein n=1 Tax=Pseudomassariella vexata TaxID=1141098 RepID=A0A1Y2DXT1_9PEZI|nr:major facilitator superfamily domain-containing protein [Pseudomassariella vexata]ORY63924.1 major facilitator superfamily domain-containing protein [Pseudomassariella vexata]